MICRGFSTDVVPYRHVNNWILDACEWLNGSLEIGPFQLVIDIRRVSADTKRCGSPLYLAPAGGLCLPSGKHGGILTEIQTKVNEKISHRGLVN